MPYEESQQASDQQSSTQAIEQMMATKLKAIAANQNNELNKVIAKLHSLAIEKNLKIVSAIMRFESKFPQDYTKLHSDLLAIYEDNSPLSQSIYDVLIAIANAFPKNRKDHDGNIEDTILYEAIDPDTAITLTSGYIYNEKTIISLIDSNNLKQDPVVNTKIFTRDIVRINNALHKPDLRGALAPAQMNSLINKLINHAQYPNQRFWGRAHKNFIEKTMKDLATLKPAVSNITNSTFQGMLRRANEHRKSSLYTDIISLTYTITLELAKYSPKNEKNYEGKLCDPVTGEPIDTDNAIVLSTGYAYNISSLRHLAAETVEDGHRIAHQNHGSHYFSDLIQQDITHIREELARNAAKQINALPAVAVATPTTTEAHSIANTTPVVAELIDIDLSYCDKATIQATPLHNKQAGNVNISGSNFSGQDLSTFLCKEIIIDKETNLIGTKISQEILAKATPESKPFIAQAIASTYYEKSSWFNLKAWKVWADNWYHYLKGDGKELESTMESLNKNANSNDKGASYAALKTHGLFSQSSNATMASPNAQAASAPAA
jgi:hypothetical protein